MRLPHMWYRDALLPSRNMDMHQYAYEPHFSDRGLHAS